MRKPRFDIKQEMANELRRKVPAADRALFNQTLVAVARDPDGNLAGHLVGQASQKVHGGLWTRVSPGELARALTSSEGSLHDCRHVAGMWSAQEIAQLPLGWSIVVVIARRAPKLARQIGKTVKETRDLLADLAARATLKVRELKDRIVKLAR